jgi:cyclase
VTVKPTLLIAGLVGLLLASAAPGVATALPAPQATPPAPASAPSAPAVLDLRQLGPTAWLLIGRDGNVLIVPDASGALIVDDGRSRGLAEIRAAALAASSGAVRYAVNTHWHLDHSGGNAGLAQDGAVVIAHRNVRARLGQDQFMAAYNRTIPASPPIALPAIVFDQTLTIHHGGEVIQLVHTPAAHTDGDILAYLEHANALHMGDVFFNGLYPFIDRSSGGTIQGLIASVDVGLSMTNAETAVIPAHGPQATRADLAAYRAMLATVRDRVQARIDAGEALDAIVAARLAADYALGGDADGFVAAIHDSLTAIR